MAKLIFYPEKCKGCFYCIEACPKKILKQSSATNKKGWFFVEQKPQTECAGCGFCYLVCPDCAIEVVDE